MKKPFIFVLSLIMVSTVLSQSENEKRGAIAGRYIGAVVLADEFSKTKCGATANFSDHQLNVGKAISNVKSKFIGVSASELDTAFSTTQIQIIRQEMRELISTFKPEKCEEAKRTLINFVNGEINKWNAFK